MSDRDPDDERECQLCGLLISSCTCCPREPSDAELEDRRRERLTRSERSAEEGQR
jgi:hypothetical protein